MHRILSALLLLAAAPLRAQPGDAGTGTPGAATRTLRPGVAAGGADAGTALDAGEPLAAGDGGVRFLERDITAQDGGLAVEDPGPDGGTTALAPPTLLTDSPAPYPEAALAEGAAGEVVLDLLVGASGAVEEVKLERGVHPALDAAAQDAAKGLKFAPARLGDEPVSVRLHFTYRFTAPAPPADPRTAVLQGIVRARGHRRPVVGARVQTDRGDAVETGPGGKFELPLRPGETFLSVTAPGFLPGNFREQLRAGERLDVIYAIEPRIVSPYETIVQDTRERTEVTRVTLQDAELREVPGTMGDPFRVVLLLPGVTTMMSGLAYPIVRGSEPAATGYFLDGIRIPILFHLMLGPAVVHPDFIEAMDFYPGLPPVEYGRLIGGVIDAKVRKPRESGLRLNGYADLINAGLFAEYPFESTGTSLTAAGRISYTGWLIALAGDAIAELEGSKFVADLWDYQVRVDQRLPLGRIRALAFGASDVVGVGATETGGNTGLNSIRFHRGDLRWRAPLGGGELETGFTVGQDVIGLEFGQADVARLDFALFETHYRGRVSWEGTLIPELIVRGGVDLESRISEITAELAAELLQEGVPLPASRTIRQPVAQGVFFGAWIQAKWRFLDRWSLIPGLRFDNYHLRPAIDEQAFEPRVTLLGELTDRFIVKAGAGFTHQTPTFVLPLPAADLAGIRLGLQEAAQLSAGFEWTLFDGLELNVEGYYAPRFRSLEVTLLDEEDFLEGGIPLENTVEDQFDAFATRGRAYGLEVMVRHPLGRNWFGWISYTLQRAERFQSYLTFDARGEVTGRTSGWLPFFFDQTHVLNAVVSYQFQNGWTAGAVFHLNTGFPETSEVLRSRTQRVLVEDGAPDRWIYVSRADADRLPMFPRLDVRIAKTWIFDRFTLQAYLDVLNIGFSWEVLGWNYTYVNGEPVREAFEFPFFAPALGLKGSY